MPASKHHFRAFLGILLGLLARVWLWTLRLTVQVHPSLAELAAANPDRPWVLAFLHGKQWPLLAWNRRRSAEPIANEKNRRRSRRSTVVMVSLSKDGAMQTRALSLLGLHVVRGSSSRGGVRALAAIVRKLKGGDHDAAFAVDGPRGPYGVVKPGVLGAAKASNAIIVPLGSAMASGKVLHRAWDRFELAWPFSRVAVVLGAPVEVGPSLIEEDLATRLGDVNDQATALLAVRPALMLRFPKFLP